jgi:hypothetical protein
MISTDLFELIKLFIDGKGRLESKIFGLADFSESELLNANFELIGESEGFHFFEKAYEVFYSNRKITILLKQYFFGCESLGAGLSIAGGARLVALLKKLIFANPAIKKSIDVYLSEDKTEGALILFQKFVIRFDQWSKRSSYTVSTIEAEFDNERFGDIAKKAVFNTYERLSTDSISGANLLVYSNALRRLIRTISARG